MGLVSVKQFGLDPRLWVGCIRGETVHGKGRDMKVTKWSYVLSFACTVAVALGLVAAPASAKPIERAHYQESGSEIPTDFSDDEFIADLGLVKGSTGRNDTQGRDFCEDIHTFIGMPA